MIPRPQYTLTHLIFFVVLSIFSRPSHAEVHVVTVGDNFFSPSELTIQPGDTVRWVNADGGNIHNVTSTTGAFDASGTSSSFTFEVVFNNPGSFPYNCTIHPGSMQGTITVEGAMTGPELVLQSVDAMNGSYAPGELFNIDLSILNSGDAESGPFSVGYYASDNNTITDSDELLGTDNIGSIGMGATLDHQAMVTVPESLPAGDYFIGAIITFADANADNNTNLDSTPITIRAPFFINAGLNDAWVNADAGLQGFFFTVFPGLKFFFLSWFTFDSVLPIGEDTAVFGAFDQRWVTGSGFYEGDSVTLNMELTSGGVFNTSDPLAGQLPGYGTITIQFISCNEALLSYDFPSLGLSGQMIVTRTLPDNVALCDVLNVPPDP